MTYRYANPEKTGVIRMDGDRVVYIDGGAEYAKAISLGPLPYTPPPPPDPAETLAQERAAMTCTPMQGILALGETQWNAILSYRDTQATWAEKVIVDGAQTWVRNSQNIAFFQYLLGLTDTQVDDLFRVAATIEA